MKLLEDINLTISQDIGLDFLTKLMGGKLVPKMEELLLEKKDECIKNISPRAIYHNFDILKVEGDSVYFKSGDIFTGPNISKILKGSHEATIFICTLGEKVDEIIKKTSAGGDTLATIIMDSITTSILVVLADLLGEKIREEGIRKEGWGSTCVYSPGQYRWTIEEQKKLFSMVDGNMIKVSLNKSYLMVPFKSVSGVYGFGPLETIDKTRVACDLCPRHDCIGRR